MLSWLWDIAKAVFGWAQAKLDPEKALAHQQQMKDSCESHLLPMDHRLPPEIIILNIRKHRKYPNLDLNEPGAEPGWKAEVKDVQHKGLELFSGIHFARQNSGEWEIVQNEDEGKKIYVVAHLPYDRIRHVDWNGDHFSSSPKMFCRFTWYGDPYDELRLYEITNPGPNEHFAHVGAIEPPHRKPLYQRIVKQISRTTSSTVRWFRWRSTTAG